MKTLPSQMVELKATPCDERIHLLSPLCHFMERKALSAVFLTLIMLLSGCLGSDSPDNSSDDGEKFVEVTASMELNEQIADAAVGDIVVIEGYVDVQPFGTIVSYEYDLITPSGIRDIDSTFSQSPQDFRLILMPDEPGDWAISVRMIAVSYTHLTLPTICSV